MANIGWSEERGEQLSAFVDGELGRPEREALLHDLEQQPALQQQWARYHLISDALRNNLPSAVHADVADRMRAVLENEPVHLHPPRRIHPVPGWVKQAGGLALAASVTAVTILGVQTLQHPGGAAPLPAPTLVAQQPAAEPTRAGASAVLASGAPAAPALTRTAVVRGGPREVDAKLDNMLLSHHEYVAGATPQGVLPYVRFFSAGSSQ
jgi:sigma-E factor negative regulatory protein RseA